MSYDNPRHGKTLVVYPKKASGLERLGIDGEGLRNDGQLPANTDRSSPVNRCLKADAHVLIRLSGQVMRQQMIRRRLPTYPGDYDGAPSSVNITSSTKAVRTR
jgi:hypothetical protein